VTRSSLPTVIGASDAGFQDLDGTGEPRARPDEGYVGQPDQIRVGEVGVSSARESVELSTNVAPVSAVGRPQSGEGVKTRQPRRIPAIPDALATVAHAGPTADQQSSSSIHGEASMNFVRNPLSTDVTDYSLSGPEFPGQGGTTSDQGGMGHVSGNLASGGATAPQGGTSGDLSRTNELLQQLIDAVRKQRGSSLPPGGPSVYPDR